MDEKVEVEVTPRHRGHVKKSCFRIEKSLIKLKFVFFLLFLGAGVITPFLSIFLKNLGLHATEAGIIGGVLPLLIFPIRPIIGGFAERFGFRKLLLVVSFLIFLLSRICFLQVPPYPKLPRHLILSNSSQSESDDLCINRNVEILDCTSHCLHPTDSSYYSNETTSDSTLYCIINPSVTNNVTNKINLCNLHKEDSSTEAIVVELVDLDLSLVPIEYQINSSQDRQCAAYTVQNLVYQPIGENEENSTCSLYTSMTCTRDESIFATLAENHIFGITFWISLLLFFTSSLSEFIIISGIDAVAYDQLRGTSSSYGLQRVVGSVGYAIAALPAAFILDASMDQGQAIDFTLPIYAGSGLMFICMVVVATLKIPSQEKVKNVAGIFFSIVKSGEVILFFCVSGFLGALHQIVEIFLFWYLKELGSTQLIMGLAIVMRTVGELVCMTSSGLIIQKLGQVRTLYIAIFANVIRLGSYSFLTNPWYVLPIEPLHGFTFCLMWAATSYHASTIAPPAILFTFQSVLSGVIVGFGGGTGVLLTGYLFDNIGAVWTFRSYSISAVVVLFIYWFLQTFLFGRRKHEGDDSSEKDPPSVDEKTDEAAVPLKAMMPVDRRRQELAVIRTGFLKRT